LVLEEPPVLEIVENDEISINYIMNKMIWNRHKVNVDKAFVYNIIMNTTSDNED